MYNGLIFIIRRKCLKWKDKELEEGPLLIHVNNKLKFKEKVDGQKKCILKLLRNIGNVGWERGN